MMLSESDAERDDEDEGIRTVVLKRDKLSFLR
jgi:hypothetical protein